MPGMGKAKHDNQVQYENSSSMVCGEHVEIPTADGDCILDANGTLYAGKRIKCLHLKTSVSPVLTGGHTYNFKLQNPLNFHLYIDVLKHGPPVYPLLFPG